MEDTREKAVSLLTLGSWHVHCRLTPDESVELIKAALDRGINSFDVADYWDNDVKNTVRFKEVMQTLDVPREDYKVAIKVFPNSVDSRETVLRRELERMELDHVDTVLCSRPTAGETLDHALECMDDLVKNGLAKSIDLSMWDPVVALEALQLIKEKGLTMPRCIQFPYNLGRRDVVESEAFAELFRAGLKLQAGFPMEGGLLCGHVHRRRYEPEDKAAGIWYEDGDRNMTRDHGEIRPKIAAIVPKLQELAATLGVSSGQLALAYVAANPYLDNVVFGATKIWQIDEAITAVELGLTKPEAVREIANEVYVSGAAVPGYFDYGRFKV